MEAGSSGAKLQPGNGERHGNGVVGFAELSAVLQYMFVQVLHACQLNVQKEFSSIGVVVVELNPHRLLLYILLA